MSQENVDRALELLGAFNRRDLEAFVALADDGIEVESRLVAMEGGYHGHEGLRTWWGDFLGAFPDYNLEVEELRDLGDVTLGHMRGRGHGADSATPLVDPFWIPMRWRDGKLVWWRNCATEADALEAVGLPEQAMSQENVEIVERAIAAVNARDLEAYLACCTQDIELHTPMVAGVYEGPAGIRRFLADVEDAVPDFRLNLERVRAIGPDWVLVFLDITASGRASGLPTGRPTANVYELLDGKIRRVRVFADRQQALEAVGLRE